MQYLRPTPRPTPVSDPAALRAATEDAETVRKLEEAKARQEFKKANEMTAEQEASKKKEEADKEAAQRAFEEKRRHEAFLAWHENMLKELNEQRVKELTEARHKEIRAKKDAYKKKAEDAEWMKNLESQPSYRLYSRDAQKRLKSMSADELRQNLDNHEWRLELEKLIAAGKANGKSLTENGVCPAEVP